MNREKPKRLDTTNVVLEFGKYQSIRIQRVPVSYLRFMVRNRTRQWEFAEAELDRRGTVVPKIEIAGHAIDAASLRIRRIWHEHRDENQGLHSWLCHAAWEAWNSRRHEKQQIVDHLGVRWVFDVDGVYPILKTVMPIREKDDNTRPEEKATHRSKGGRDE